MPCTMLPLWRCKSTSFLSSEVNMSEIYISHLKKDDIFCVCEKLTTSGATKSKMTNFSIKVTVKVTK